MPSKSFKNICKNDYLNTLSRFSVSFIVFAALFIAVLVYRHFIGFSTQFNQALHALTLTGIGSVGIKLLCEKRGFSVAVYAAGSAVLFGFFASLICNNPNYTSTVLFLIPAMFAFIYAVQMPLKASESYQYFYKLTISAMFGVVSTVVICVGVIAICYVIEKLLISSSIHFQKDIFAFVIGLLAPLFALVKVPSGPLDDKWRPSNLLEVLFRAVGIPFILIYTVILYAYFAKILIQGTLPHGLLAYLILGYAFVGIFVHWFACLDQSGPKISRFYKKSFAWLLLVPAGVLLYAVYLRYVQYGMTPWRYAVAVAGLWVLAYTLYMVLCSKLHLKRAISSLGILLALSAFGPWGAVKTSVRSQFNGLKNALIESHILQDGKIVKSAEVLPPKQSAKIKGSLTFLYDYQGLDLVKPWLRDESTALKDLSDRRTIQLLWEEMAPIEITGTRFFDYPAPEVQSELLQVQGFNFMARGKLMNHSKELISQKIFTGPGGVKLELRFNAKMNTLTVSSSEEVSTAIDLNPYLEMAAEPNQSKVLTYDGELDGKPLRVVLTSVVGRITGGKVQASAIEFMVLN